MTPDDKTAQEYEQLGIAPPSVVGHGVTSDDIRARLKPFHPTNYRLDGNRLIADTELGELVNFIPTDWILTGTDSDGLPTFRQLG